MLDAKTARYLAALVAGPGPDSWGFAYLDVTTGELRATGFAADCGLTPSLARVAAREILATRPRASRSPSAIGPPGRPSRRCAGVDAATLVVEALVSPARRSLGLASRCRSRPLPSPEAIAYARATQPAGALPLARIVVYRTGETLVLDDTARTNLELTETILGRKRDGSLLAILDETKTAPGGRELRRWLLFPLTSIGAIRRRQDAVEALVEKANARTEIRARLREIHDLERLAGRVTLGNATPRDRGALRRSLERFWRGPGSLCVRGARPRTRPAGALEARVAPPAAHRAGRCSPGARRRSADQRARGRPRPRRARAGYRRAAPAQERRAGPGILAIEARERERTDLVSEDPFLQPRLRVLPGDHALESEERPRRLHPQADARERRAVRDSPSSSTWRSRVLGAEEKALRRDGALRSFGRSCAAGPPRTRSRSSPPPAGSPRSTSAPRWTTA